MNAASTNKRWLNAVRPKELADVYRAAMDAGCECWVGKSTHVKIKTPSGATINGPLTSSGGRSDRQMRSKLRAAGVELPEKRGA